jgi:hypothetical protein
VRPTTRRGPRDWKPERHRPDHGPAHLSRGATAGTVSSCPNRQTCRAPKPKPASRSCDGPSGGAPTPGSGPDTKLSHRPGAIAPASPTVDSDVDTLVLDLAGDLEVTGVLGDGGMGQVLAARQRSLARLVALKRVRPAHATSETEAALLDEGRITGGLEHPNIVPVHALGRDDVGNPVLVMKRIEGTSWRALLDDDAHPAWAPLLAAHGDRTSAHLEVLMRVADAAHFAHARGVVHRDIKPENVMVGSFGEVYLVDWGIAVRVGRTVADGDGAFRIRGTPAYMAPEMIGGDPARVDARTDVYLLGGVLHVILTGRPPNAGQTLTEVCASALRGRGGGHLRAGRAPRARDALPGGARPRPRQAPGRSDCNAGGAPRVAAPAGGRRSRARCPPPSGRGGAACRGGLGRDGRAGGPGARRDRLSGRVRRRVAGVARQPRSPGRAGCGVVCACSITRWTARTSRRPRRFSTSSRSRVSNRVSLAERARRLEACQVERRAFAEAADHGRRMAQALDERTSLRERRWLWAVLLGSTTAVLLLILSRGGLGGITVPETAFFALFVDLALIGAAYVGRRALLANVFNRRVTGVVIWCMTALVFHRFAAAHAGETQVEAVLLTDLWILVGATGVAAFTVQRLLAPIAATFAICALGAGLFPEATLVLFAVAPVFAVVAALWAHGRALRRG